MTEEKKGFIVKAVGISIIAFASAAGIIGSYKSLTEKCKDLNHESSKLVACVEGDSGLTITKTDDGKETVVKLDLKGEKPCTKETHNTRVYSLDTFYSKDIGCDGTEDVLYLKEKVLTCTRFRDEDIILGFPNGDLETIYEETDTKGKSCKRAKYGPEGELLFLESNVYDRAGNISEELEILEYKTRQAKEFVKYERDAAGVKKVFQIQTSIDKDPHEIREWISIYERWKREDDDRRYIGIFDTGDGGRDLLQTEEYDCQKDKKECDEIKKYLRID